MNGRVYDPVLGRFLSPDNYVQLPDFTQSFNRYAYALNNPLKYTDPSGEIVWFVPIIAGAAIGGTMNVLMNRNNISSFEQGLLYFGAGALVGGFSAYVGGVTGVATQALGIIPGAVQGFAFGATTGAISNGGLQLMNNAIAGNPLWQGVGRALWQGALMGGIGGAISGGLQGYRNAKAIKANVLTGRKIEVEYDILNEHKIKQPYTLQPDKTKHCYAYASEYAVKYHSNEQAKVFIDAMENQDGANLRELWDKFDVPHTYFNFIEDEYGEDFYDIVLKQAIEADYTEIMTTMDTYNGYEGNPIIGHTINVIGMSKQIKYRIFFGGTRAIYRFDYFDPAKGFIYNQKINFLDMLFLYYK